jgi:uncharacterized membrane protein
MSESLSILSGLASATTFGSGDFTGGFSTKKHNVFFVLFLSQIAGVSLLIILTILAEESITPNQIFFGSLSGLSGAVGLLAFYRGLAVGNMAIVAPVTSVVTPLIPLFVSLLSNFQYTIFQIVGLSLALIAIWLVSHSKLEKEVLLSDLKLPVIAGIGFGLFLVFINNASTESTFFFPLVFARLASITLVFCIIVLTKRFERVNLKSFSIIALTGILDALGNLFFVISAQLGRLDISSILTSMAPAVTVLLAWLVIKEKIAKFQVLGIALAIFSIVMISL